MILLGFRILWQYLPGNVFVCALFWIVALFYTYIWFAKAHNYGAIIIGIGFCSNGLVSILNHGYMPVVGLIDSSVDGTIWIPATANTILPVLADHISYYGFSIGDMIISSGLLLGIGIYYYRRNFGV